MNLAKSLVLYILRVSARIQLWKIRPVVIGIGGSSGKTSTAKFIETILSEKYKILATAGKNSETGIPLSILGIKISNYSFADWLKVLLLIPLRILLDFKKYDFLVVEMGIDSPKPPKNMGYLLRIIKPEIGALTSIDYEHSVYFEPFVENKKRFEEEILDLIAREETLLLKSLPKDGWAVVNMDDPEILKASKDLRASQVTVSSENKDADFFLENVEIYKDRFIVEFTNKEKRFVLKIKQPLPLYFAHSFVFSIAVCSALGVDVSEAIRTLEDKFSLPPGRASVFNGIRNMIIIDSSYNSSSEAASGMLGLLKEVGKDQRKIAILGDMRELGKMSRILHEKLAEEISKNSDFAILIGPQMKKFTSVKLKKIDFPHRSFETYSAAKDFILNHVKEGDVILVKSSQNTLFLERVVADLLKDKDDVRLLARRGAFWDNLRQKTP